MPTAEPPAGPGSRRPIGPTRREIVDGVAGELSLAGIESPRVDAERLVATALGIPRVRLTAEGGERVGPEGAIAVARAVSRRLSGEPLQHIEGSVDFRGLVLVADGRALVPRPETEQLVDHVARRLGDTGAPRVLEIGVGSAAIALSLLTEGLAGTVVGLDISQESLDQARENAVRAGVEDGLELRRCGPEIWPAVEGEPPFDLIVANPPYIATRDIEGLAPEVRDHEPREALDGGPDGLDVIRTIVAGAAGVLREGGSVVLEIGADQGERVARLLEEGEGWVDVRIDADLAGRPRFASARSAGPSGS